MPITIEGVTYFSAEDIRSEMSISRQTIWRWRKTRKIPQGHRYRDSHILFTREEFDAIRMYAHRLAPAMPAVAKKSPNFRKRSRK